MVRDKKVNLGGLDYRVEFYHQFGDAGAVEQPLVVFYYLYYRKGDSVDSRCATMFGIRLGKTFQECSMEPQQSLYGMTILSGTDDG